MIPEKHFQQSGKNKLWGAAARIGNWKKSISYNGFKNKILGNYYGTIIANSFYYKQLAG